MRMVEQALQTTKRGRIDLVDAQSRHGPLATDGKGKDAAGAGGSGQGE